MNQSKMKYIGMPMGMWLLFSKSFQKQLSLVSVVKNKDAQIIEISY